jgi:hypothetical protein
MIVFFDQGVSSEGMFTISCSFTAINGVFVFYFVYSDLRVKDEFIILVFGLRMK